MAIYDSPPQILLNAEEIVRWQSGCAILLRPIIYCRKTR